jgi:F0F1-type ATP synthase membrane subunit b/b'
MSRFRSDAGQCGWFLALTVVVVAVLAWYLWTPITNYLQNR